MSKYLFVDIKGWKYNIHFHRDGVTIDLQHKIGFLHWETVDSSYCPTPLVDATIRELDQRNAWRIANVVQPSECQDQ